MIGQTLIAALGYTFAKSAALEIAPPVLTLLRMTASALFFAVLFWMRGGFNGSLPASREWIRLAVLAALGVSLNQYLFLFGLKFTTPANTALLYAMTPAVVFIIAAAILRSEKVTAQKLTGISLALLGVGVVFFARGYTFEPELMYGNLIISGAVTSWALYIALGKKILARYDAVQSAALMMMLGAAIYFPFGIFYLPAFEWHTVSAQAWIGLAYITFLSSAAAYLLLNYAMSKLESSQVSIFMNAQPIVATVFSVLVYGEVVTGNFIFGGLVAVAGIFIMNSPPLFLRLKPSQS